MSTQVFPSLAGLGWNVSRSEIWKTRNQQSIGGKETRLADWSYPRHQWTLTFDFLRQGTLSGASYAEFAEVAAFFDLRSGMYDSFLYRDADDNAVTGQGIGTGDGTTTSFQLARAFGGFAEPILAPDVVSHVYRAGTDHSDWTVAAWGSSTPGVVTFSAAPGAGQAITADFTYYFPCRFAADQLDFEKFMAALYQLKKVSFVSIK